MRGKMQDHTDTRRGARHSAEEGFALPATIFVLVLLGVMGVTALQSSTDELLSATAVHSSNEAFYAAEAGIHSAVSNWDQDAMDALVTNPGDSLVASWATIANRCSYQIVYRRIDGGDTSEKLYSVESTGQSPGLNGGRRRVGIIVKTGWVDAALVFGGDAIISGNPTVKGACPDIHSNGDLDVPGNATIGGDLTASGSAFVGGSVQDTLGNGITPMSGAPDQPILDLDPDDYCGEADYIFTDEWGLEVATTTLRNLESGAYWGWKWSGGGYQTDNDNVSEGVYCMNNDVQIGNQLGSSSTPLAITLLTTESVMISGNPYITPAHSDSILIIADGDVKLNGNATGGADNFEGLVYAGSQCEVSGRVVIHGQLICRDDPNPFGSEDWVSENRISGDMQLTFSCGEMLPDPGRPIGERVWSHVW